MKKFKQFILPTVIVLLGAGAAFATYPVCHGRIVVLA